MNTPFPVSFFKSNFSISRVKHLWRNGRDRLRFIEMLVFALAVPLLGAYLFAQDPLGLNSGFPWLAALPVVFAARYGSGWGLGCALVSAATCTYPWQIYEGQASALLVLALGTVIVSVVVGDSASSWRRRSGQAEAENQYLRHRLKEFSNDYHVLKVSHGQLEEYMAGQRMSLRQALQQLRPVLSSSDDGLQAGSELMSVFAQFCSVQIAGLYAMKNESVIDIHPVATHGEMMDLPVFDPLLRLALKERQVVSVKLQSLANNAHDSELLAVVPLVDAQDHLHGVLAIKDMHFMAFQQENLNFLALLGGYIGDMLTRSRGQSQSNAGWFSAELDTALRFAHSHSVQSTLLCLQLIQTDRSQEIIEFITENIRSLDSSWFPPVEHDTPSAAILMPLMSEMQCEAYLHRVAATVSKEFQLEFRPLLKTVATMQIGAGDDKTVCLDFIRNHTDTDIIPSVENDLDTAVARHVA